MINKFYKRDKQFKEQTIVIALIFVAILTISLIFISTETKAYAVETKAYAAETNHDTTSNVNQTSASNDLINGEILPYLLVHDSNNLATFTCTFTGYYLFQISTPGIYIDITLSVTDNFSNVVEVEPYIEIPNFTDDVGADIYGNKYKFEMENGKRYTINATLTDQYIDPELLGKDNSLNAAFLLTSWKEFKTINLNQEIIYDKNSTENSKVVPLVIGEDYTIAFNYEGGIDSNYIYPHKWKISNNGIPFVDLDSNGNGFTIKNNANNINKQFTIQFLDNLEEHVIIFKIVDVYSAKINYNPLTYLINITYINNLTGESADKESAGFDRMEIDFESLDDNQENDLGLNNISADVFDISNAPVKGQSENFTIKVFLDTSTNYSTMETKTMITKKISLNEYSGSTNDKRLIFYGEVEDKTINLYNPVKAIFFDTSETYENLRINIDVTHEIDIFFNGITLKATSGYIIDSEASITNIHLSGNNAISGKSTDYLIQAKGITFTGDGTLDAKGENGKRNPKASNESSINGDYGENGTSVIYCINFTDENNKLIIKGGDGENGSNGYIQTSANGKDGGNGGNGGNAGVGLAIGSSHYYLGKAGIGGDGGHGGDGANGRDAYISRYFYLYNGVGHTLYKATVGGNGGNGGNAGLNGSGSTDHISEYPRGGNGGNGGKGGNGLATKVKENGNVPPPSIVIQVSIKYESPSGAGGDGGHGGHGYIGGIGGNGGNGGNGANGFDAVFLGSTGSNGGDGADGGNGGNGGDSWANTMYVGGAGGSGAGGGSGGIKGDGILTEYVDGKPGEPGLNGTRGSGKTSSSCVTEGTLITLADGRKVLVENLTGTEMLLVWNMFTGKFGSAPILFIDKDARTNYEVINLYFSDGTSVKVIDEHGFWNIDLNKYVFLRNDAAQYIGHWFNKQTTDANGNMTWTAVQLTNVVVANEITTAWSPVTYGHLCYYVNGMLSMPGATTGFINIFDVDPVKMAYDMNAFNADIAEYGLFTYEEFYNLLPVPEMVFEAFNGQYLKVAIGKGLTSMEEIGMLFERYAEFFINEDLNENQNETLTAKGNNGKHNGQTNGNSQGKGHNK